MFSSDKIILNKMDARMFSSDKILLSKNSFKWKEHTIIHSKFDSYLVENKLGEGSFGKVIRCRNLHTDELRAIKVLKRNTNAGKAELKALKAIRQLDADKTNLIKFYEGFNYKGHKCLVFEFLSQSLYDFFIDRKLLPLHVSEIRVIAQQMLVALDALKSIGIVHCDIKSDNIMLVNHELQPFKVKLIDFGNAMRRSTLERVEMIQALGYRAPEVVLGLPLEEGVDMWALGCVLALVFIGRHMYPVQSEYEFIRVITKLHGFPEDEILKKGTRVSTFFTFTEDLFWKLNTNEEYQKLTGKKVVKHSCIDKYIKTFDELPRLHPGLDDLVEEKDTRAFMSLLKRMLHINPAKRITPSQALGHRFITMSHLSHKSRGPYVSLAHANMRESQLEEAEVGRYKTSSENLCIFGSAISCFDHQPEEDYENEEYIFSIKAGRLNTESQTDPGSQGEMVHGVETSQKVAAALQQYKKLSCKKGRILIHVKPQMSSRETPLPVRKQIRPTKLQKCVSNSKLPNPLRSEGKVDRASSGAVSSIPGPCKEPTKSENEDRNLSFLGENYFDSAESAEIPDKFLSIHY
ncbi:homeodomain-interacting protein kinase 1-like [Poeciliopsis prolifica]|uniref:homeodomain-interacting protein kinase 1-like n=1 Tax=Poeciliopsis prolifica TaxID=188132 RepID=UPI0024131E25|nr:homeodomain-interacting protein kinase 1-like [Poeciliopsis prolifica]